MSELTTPKMSHEEMMDTLKGLVFGTFDRTTSKEREALDMAISALSAKEPKNGERFSCPNCGFKADWFIPDREKGEWIPMYDRWGDIVTTVCGYECSKCGEWNADNDNFCPNCGADMRK